MAHQPTRLCIVSRDRLRSSDFIAALRASLRPEDQLQIIMDRRHGGSSGGSDPKEDRRRQLRVDLALEADGFAIVPASVDPTAGRNPLSLLVPEAPIERFSPEDAEDEERLESILAFKRRRPGRLIPKLLAVLIGVTLAAFALSPAGQDLGKSLMSRVFQGSPPPLGAPGQPPVQTNEATTLAQLPAVTEEPAVAETQPARTEIPPPARPARESPSAGGPASTESVSPRDADRQTATPRETSIPPKEAGTASRETSTSPEEASTPARDASTTPKQTSAPPKAATGQGGSGRPRPSATVRPSSSAPAPSKQVASAPPPEAATPKTTAPRFEGSPRVELVREPVSRGWGESYAVRLLDPAGRPMAGADVVLVAQMADGTVENIPMGALPEPGTYRGTVPTGRSTPVDLRVRVSTGDKLVEVPVRP
ncbi:MAG TPA: hypothetical protein VGK54_10250 [Chloroflexota bacterium]